MTRLIEFRLIAGGVTPQSGQTVTLDIPLEAIVKLSAQDIVERHIIPYAEALIRFVKAREAEIKRLDQQETVFKLSADAKVVTHESHSNCCIHLPHSVETCGLLKVFK